MSHYFGIAVAADRGRDTMSSSFYRQADRLMLAVLWAMTLYAFGLAFWHATWAAALVIGGGTALALSALYSLIGGSRAYRCLIGVAFMVLSALHIQQSHGMIEMHFSVFVLLAFLVYYRDWLPILLAAGAIAGHHLAFFLAQRNGDAIYLLQAGSGWPVVLIHAAYVVVETLILLFWRATADARRRSAKICNAPRRICCATARRST
jgi:methyl-accepting chemotaxis protein